MSGRTITRINYRKSSQTYDGTIKLTNESTRKRCSRFKRSNEKAGGRVKDETNYICRYVQVQICGASEFLFLGFFSAEDYIQRIFIGLYCHYLSLFFPGHASCSSLCRCVEQQRMAVTCAGRHGACPNGKWARAHSQKREMKDFESLESSFRSIVVE